MLPLILAGRLVAWLRPLPRDYRIFYFFSFYHVGGAEKVHAQVATATGGADCIIYFTRRSANNLLREAFIQSGCEVRDISRYTDNKWLYPVNIFMRGLIAGYINAQRSPASVFNGQNNLGYKISPWINARVPQIELIHSLNTFSYIRIPFLPFITKTIMISRRRILDHFDLYKRKGIPHELRSRIVYIGNAIELPEAVKPKNHNHFVVLYAGRGGHEKRLDIVAEVARKLSQTEAGVSFEIMGDVSGILNQDDHPYIHFKGNVGDADVIRSLYERASVLILTSETEGFPMVIIEAMAYGTAILSTAVGDIPEHVIDGRNGFLFSDTRNKALIVQEAVAKILLLKQDKGLYEQISHNNMRYAKEHFNLQTFNAAYRAVFQPLNRAD